MSEALRTLEVAEARDQLQILSDLSASTMDTVRVRVHDQDAYSGLLRLDRAVEIVRNTHDLMLAAACAAVEPKLFYASRKPPKAVEYMREVKMGQTERGSFVVMVLSGLPPEIVPASQTAELGIETPFERQVTGKLSQALTAATTAVAHTVATGKFDGFEEAVQHGVSANLCDALSGLSLFEGFPHVAFIELSWALSRPVPPLANQRFAVTPEHARVFKEVATVLKTKAPGEEFEARGPVTRLRREPPAPRGEITLVGNVDGVGRNISISLSGDDHSLAVRAHDERKYLSAIGVLRKEGRSYRLTDPRNVRIVEEDSLL
jgi:hypothetical protein